MKNTWFIADTHFSHANIIKHTNRPFGDVETHDRVLMENWNRHVARQDDVYFLGDFAFKYKDRAKEIRRRLHGAQIFFIEGNHDAAARQIRNSFAWFDSVKMVEVNGQKIWLSHYAHRVWDRAHYGVWHLYGHSHHSLPDDPHAQPRCGRRRNGCSLGPSRTLRHRRRSHRRTATARLSTRPL